MVDIEPERAGDADEIRRVLGAAFEDGPEADLVDVLREDGDLRLDCSVVARDDDGTTVGYAAVSDVALPARPDAIVAVLGPVAVLPDRQGHGIGSKLVRAALQRCVQAGCDAVVLEGDPEFYERFGFVAAEPHGLESDLDPPPGTFQVWPCRPGALDGVAGLVRHPAPFHAL